MRWVFLRYVLVHGGVRQPSGCLTPHINVTDVRSAKRILVVNPLRPEARCRDTVADDVDGQEQAAPPIFPR